MFDRTEIVYEYDGSFEGLMCCVFESFSLKEVPSVIRTPSDQQSFFDTAKWIETDILKFNRVYKSIAAKISIQAQELVQLGFWTNAPQKEMLIYHFLRLGYKHGSKVMSMLTDDTVSTLQKAVRHLTSESHKFKGFVRFSVYDKVMVAVIEPKNFVLPLISYHFCDRFRDDSFMIYDKTHSMALVYHGQKAELIRVDQLTLPEVDESEIEYRHLWKQFYNTIAIEARNNPKCRMTLMPKRYWGQMTEFAKEEELQTVIKNQQNPSKQMILNHEPQRLL
ncbi:putative DNA metabolism protein [Desulfosporosinus acidiphilus SJ4]|uniref:Putative DNA metabolism protein n=1 Tax=Desulfosporosinus acidiphilus (strain DSM 22704 / JCM 16185 / SJ4) TaxID=646529 RepID=I4D9C3_DESAJ|nr:TIGR03915 family putative DNA repair protein [Desulfosporosinus acidiphilus]AFM42397.1 putative DNA metabolism protein [Desulfosporosinus acidiphilus SJ4]